MPFCGFCRVILVTRYPDGPYLLGAGCDEGEDKFNIKKNVSEIKSHAIRYHETVRDLVMAAQTCSVCSAVWRICQQRSMSRELYEHSSRLFLIKQLLAEGFILMTSQPRRRDEGDEEWLTVLAVINIRQLSSDMVTRRVEEMQRAFAATGRLIDAFGSYSDLEYEGSLTFLTSLVIECLAGHRLCQSSSQVETLPTRVIDLGVTMTDSIRVVEPGGAKAHYAALSYCWGTEKFMTLRKETATQLLGGFSPRILPLCFQDAIEVARRFHLRYLWIDALCICQDDLEDWARESARMADVYSNAFVTIAAAGSNSPAQGLRGQLSDWQMALHLYEVPYAPGTLHGCIALALDPCLHFEGVDGQYQRSNEPLDTRGWAFQEKWFATRYVQFCRGVVQYKCPQHFVNNHGYERLTLPAVSMPLADPADVNFRRFVDALRRYLPILQDSSFFPEPSKLNVRTHSAWIGLVESYSAKRLTRITDKFHALSGLARAFSSHLHCQYIAGHWRDDLPKSLCWKAVETAPADGEFCRFIRRGITSLQNFCCRILRMYPANLLPDVKPSTLVSQPTVYIAPSWSWASAASGVDFMTIIGASFKDVATLEGLRVVPSTSDTFGRIDEAEISLVAPLTRIFLDVWTPSEEEHTADPSFEPFVITVEDEGDKYRRVVDTRLARPQLIGHEGEAEIYPLALTGALYGIILGDCWSDWNTLHLYRWLLISPTTTPGEYRRVGLLVCRFFDRSEIPRKKVILV